jgi:hypothetical protein
LLEISASPEPSKASMTLGELLKRFRQDQPAVSAKSTMRRNAQDRCILDSIGPKPVNEISREDARAFRASLIAKKLNPGTAEQYFAALVACLEWACAQRGAGTSDCPAVAWRPCIRLSEPRSSHMSRR